MRATQACHRYSIIEWAHANMAAYKSPRLVEIVETLPKLSLIHI